MKSGWLRKQGGIVKSWHRRYFIMKGDYLYYYTTDDDYITGKQPLGNIFLPGNHVAEIPYTPADSEKFQFEIQTGLYLLLVSKVYHSLFHLLSAVHAHKTDLAPLEKIFKYETRFNSQKCRPDARTFIVSRMFTTLMVNYICI